jgi:Ni/Co efflux regulator RcnB
MRKADNENEPFPFVTLAAAAARVLQSAEKQDERSDDARRSSDENEGDHEQRRRYVEHRLREIADFERRANGETVPRRRPFR